MAQGISLRVSVTCILRVSVTRICGTVWYVGVVCSTASYVLCRVISKRGVHKLIRCWFAVRCCVLLSFFFTLMCVVEADMEESEATEAPEGKDFDYDLISQRPPHLWEAVFKKTVQPPAAPQVKSKPNPAPNTQEESQTLLAGKRFGVAYVLWIVRWVRFCCVLLFVCFHGHHSSCQKSTSH